MVHKLFRSQTRPFSVEDNRTLTAQSSEWSSEEVDTVKGILFRVPSKRTHANDRSVTFITGAVVLVLQSQ